MVWLSTAYDITGLTALAGGIGITVLAALLMMSRFRFYSFKEFNLGTRVRFQTLILIPLVLIIISVNPPVVCFSMFVIYVSSGPLLWFLRWREKKQARSEQPPAPS